MARYLGTFAAGICAVAAGPSVVAFLIHPASRDHFAFRASGEAVWHGNYAGAFTPTGFWLPHPYPPTTFPLMAILAALPVRVGYLVTVLSQIIALGLAIRIMERTFCRHSTYRHIVRFLIISSPAYAFTIAAGQVSATHALLMAWVLVAWHEGRETTAGFALGLLCLEKPQLGLVFLPLAVLVRGWRLAATAIGVGMMGVLGTLPSVGLNTWRAWLEAATALDEHAHHDLILRLGTTWYAWCRIANWGVLAWGLPVVPAAVALVCAWRRPGRERYALAILFVLLGNVHVLHYDAALLGGLAAYLVSTRMAMLGAIVSFLMLALGSMVARPVLATPALALWFGMLFADLMGTPATTDTAPRSPVEKSWSWSRTLGRHLVGGHKPTRRPERHARIPHYSDWSRRSATAP
ncbi:MAG TPA: glycosyltransferase family 87 protein [Gemmatimonadales bacterium]|nr:glycosyltransferase family 87 protein [Gemmatimonadales bacterium]